MLAEQITRLELIKATADRQLLKYVTEPDGVFDNIAPYGGKG